MWACKGMHLPCNYMYTVDGELFEGNHDCWTNDQLIELKLPKMVKRLPDEYNVDIEEMKLKTGSEKKSKTKPAARKTKRKRKKPLNKKERRDLNEALSKDLS